MFKNLFKKKVRKEQPLTTYVKVDYKNKIEEYNRKALKKDLEHYLKYNMGLSEHKSDVHLKQLINKIENHTYYSI